MPLRRSSTTGLRRPVLSSGWSHWEAAGIRYIGHDDVESFIEQVGRIMMMRRATERFRSLAERYDWRVISSDYEKVLLNAALK